MGLRRREWPQLTGERRHFLDGPRTALAVFIIATEIVFVFFMASAGIEFVLSSIVLTLALLLQLSFGMQRDAATPADIVAFIFNWLFLDLAPKIQLLSVPTRLVNTSTVSAQEVLVTNLLCALFIVTFTVIYVRMGSAASGKPNPAATMQPPFSPLGICAALAVCVLVVAALGRTPYVTDATGTAPSAMVIKKFLLFLPSATLMILGHEMIAVRKKWVFSRVFAVLILLLLVAVTENPLTEKRNALGPVYLGLLFIVFEARLRGLNKRLMLLVASMVLVFPAVTVLTHSHRQFLYGVRLDAVVDTLKDHYFSVNYDAWANLYTTVEMVKHQGIEWGRQLLGDVLFFVPSSLWHAKPLATGIAIGDYLILNYAGWFTNLSAPLVGEGYIDFGPVGVILYAGGLAYFVAWLNRFARDSRKWVAYPMGIYAALFLMFALRGSLMIAFAYGTGALLAFMTASTLLSGGMRPIGRRYHWAAVCSRNDLREGLPGLGGTSPPRHGAG
jgi:hypothetical protein